MTKDEGKEVGLGEIITTLSGAMSIVSKVARSKGALTKDIVEDAKVIEDLFRENFSEELLENR